MHVVPVYYDFASTVAWVAHRVMAEIEGRLREARVELLWTPVDLTLLTGWQRGDRLSGRRRAGGRDVALRLGYQPVVSPVWLDSRLAHAMAIRLESTPERARRMCDAVWRLVHEHGRTMDQELLEEIVVGEGLEVPFRESELATELEALESRTRDAAQLGVHGVPTFLLGVFPVGGIQEPETMLQFLVRWARRQDEERSGVEPS